MTYKSGRGLVGDKSILGDSIGGEDFSTAEHVQVAHGVGVTVGDYLNWEEGFYALCG